MGKNQEMQNSKSHLPQKQDVEWTLSKHNIRYSNNFALKPAKYPNLKISVWEPAKMLVKMKSRMKEGFASKPVKFNY